MVNKAKILTRLTFSVETIQEDLQHLLARITVQIMTRMVEDFCYEIAAQETPGRAITGGANQSSSISIKVRGRGSISKNCAGLDQGLVSQTSVRDEDCGIRVDVECDHGTVFGQKGLDEIVKLQWRFAVQQKVAYNGKRQGAWRQPDVWIENVKEGFEGSRYAEGDDDDEPSFHGRGNKEIVSPNDLVVLKAAMQREIIILFNKITQTNNKYIF